MRRVLILGALLTACAAPHAVVRLNTADLCVALARVQATLPSAGLTAEQLDTRQYLQQLAVLARCER